MVLRKVPFSMTSEGYLETRSGVNFCTVSDHTSVITEYEREKGEGRREKGEGRREKGEGEGEEEKEKKKEKEKN